MLTYFIKAVHVQGRGKFLVVDFLKPVKFRRIQTNENERIYTRR
jgi:hypothetical protein